MIEGSGSPSEVIKFRLRTQFPSMGEPRRFVGLVNLFIIEGCCCCCCSTLPFAGDVVFVKCLERSYSVFEVLLLPPISSEMCFFDVVVGLWWTSPSLPTLPRDDAELGDEPWITTLIFSGVPLADEVIKSFEQVFVLAELLLLLLLPWILKFVVFLVTAYGDI